jgi:hypothetical protein
MSAAKREAHGATAGRSKSPEYVSWQELRARCTPGTKQYQKNFANYGARGITFCARWTTFKAFFEDMGPKPTREHTIDRINNDGGYEPGNCRWATKAEQRRNSRTVRTLPVGEEVLTLGELAERSGINRTTLAKRLDSGASAAEATAMPAMTHADAAKRSRGGWGGARVSRGLKHVRRTA